MTIFPTLVLLISHMYICCIDIVYSIHLCKCILYYLYVSVYEYVAPDIPGS